MSKARRMTKGFIAVLLLAANIGLAAVVYQDAQAQGEEGCPVNCHCYDDGTGVICSAIMGNRVECTSVNDCP